MSAVTLTDFLLARVAEDEAAAQHVVDELAFLGPPTKTPRALAECEAKRRIVEREVNSRTKITFRRRMVLQDLASIYADHPDYDAEWKP